MADVVCPSPGRLWLPSPGVGDSVCGAPFAAWGGGCPVGEAPCPIPLSPFLQGWGSLGPWEMRCQGLLMGIVSVAAGVPVAMGTTLGRLTLDGAAHGFRGVAAGGGVALSGPPSLLASHVWRGWGCGPGGAALLSGLLRSGVVGGRARS